MNQATLIEVEPFAGNDDNDERYSLPETIALAKHWSRVEVKTITMLLPATRTDSRWWQELIEPRRDLNSPFQYADPVPQLNTRFLPGRIRFGHPGNPRGVGVGSPPFGCVLLMWSKR